MYEWRRIARSHTKHIHWFFNVSYLHFLFASLSRFRKLGIRGPILDIMRSMYNAMKSKVKHCNEISDSYECMLGMRQGECLSPFLFSMYLNDLNAFKMFLLLYADDMIIFGNTAEELQKGLDLLQDYCQRWKLIVNTEKTKS